MDRNNQNIWNETQDPKYDELIVYWICRPILSDEFQFTHRNIEINNYGFPVLRLYPNETKYLYKELYNYGQKVSEIKSQNGFNTLELYNAEGQKIVEYNPNKCTITSYNVGTVTLQSSLVPNIFDESKFNDVDIDDKDLIIIVEEEPIITNIEWDTENPLYLSPNSVYPIKLKLTYNNSDNREYIDENYIRFLHITNKCYLNIENDKFVTTDQKGITYVQFKAPNLSDTITPEDLKVIICNDKEIPKNAESIFRHTPSIIMDVDSSGEAFDVIEEITETKSISGTNENISYSRINDINIRIEDDGIITLENDKIKPIPPILGETHLVITSDKIDFPYYIDSEAILIPVMVIKNIESITWSITKTDLNVGDTAQLKVILHYSDGSEANITHLCTFEYDNRFITIENHEEEDIPIGLITCIAPGTTIVSVKDADFANELLSSLNDIILTITQPITSMNLNKHELELIIGDSEQLEFTYTPENASYQNLIWTSSEPNTVSVNDDGVVKALARGTSEVMISIDKTEIKIDEETGEEIEVPIDLTLPNNLTIHSVTDKDGDAEFKLMDALLYKIQIYQEYKKLSNINVTFTSINEQHIIINVTDEIPLSYKDNVSVKVLNRFNEEVIGMPVILNQLNNKNIILDTLIAKTNKSGIATLIPLNKIKTNENGVAIIDGIRIEALYDNNYLSNITIEHVNSLRLNIIIPTELNVQIMKKIKFIFTTDEEDKELRAYVDDIRIYVYMNSELIYCDYPDSKGVVDISHLYYHELEEDNITNDNGTATIYENNQMIITYNNQPLKDVDINHINSELLILTLPNELELARDKLLNIKITNSVTDLLKELNNTKLKIYMPHYDKPDDSGNAELLYYNLIYNSYFDVFTTSGINININKLNIIKSNIITNPDDDVIDNDLDDHFITYNPTRCEICKVVSRAIEVTGIKFNMNDTTIDIDDPPIKLSAEIIPSNATYQEVSYTIEDEQIARLNSDNELYGFKPGTTTITAYSVDNPSIKASANIVVTSHRIQNIIITGGNDDNYEWYDSLHQTVDQDVNRKIGVRVTDEKYDDDDFARFYVPVNNSIQLSADIIPSDAYDKTLKWLSSDNSLFKVTQNGIVTAIREGKQELDVYGDDDISETRFANTAWITALNTKYKKYGICQVRATRNNITAIDIPIPDEHDVDIDDMDAYGVYDNKSEHEFDYVIKVGETIEVPIELSVQDSNFGPSNYIEWRTFNNGNSIIKLSGGTPINDNIQDDFDWSNTTPDKVNSDKLKPVLKVTGMNIGDAEIYAKTIENTGRPNGQRLYVSRNTEVADADNFGNMKFSNILVNISWKGSQIKDKLEKLKSKIEEILAMVSGTGDIMINGVLIPVGTHISEIINPQYYDKYMVYITSATAIKTTDNKIYITVPKKEITVSLRTDGKYALPFTFTFTPFVNTNVDNPENSISIGVYPLLQSGFYDLKRTRVYLTAPYFNENGPEFKMRTWYGNLIEVAPDVIYHFTVPSNDYVNKFITSDDKDNPLYAKPGEGEWFEGPKSRIVKIRVVASPSSLQIGFCNAWDDLDNVANFNIIKNYTGYTMNKVYKDDYKYMCISFDKDFKDLLTESEALNSNLDEKYKSFAWFSDNEDVIRFEDVEDLSYRKENGDYTNNPNESFYIQELEPTTTNLANLQNWNFENYQKINNFISVKLTDGYDNSLKGTGIYVNNKNRAVIRFHALEDGTIKIFHTNNVIIGVNSETPSTDEKYKSKNKDASINIFSVPVEKDKMYYIMGTTEAYSKVTRIAFKTASSGNTPFEYTGDASFTKNLAALEDYYYPKTEYTKLNDLVSINVKGGCTDNVFINNKLNSNSDAISTIKLTPISDGKVTISYNSNGIKIKNSTGGSHSYDKNQSPITIDVSKDIIYYITGTVDASTEINSISYTPIDSNSAPHTGSYKGTKHFRVKSSRIKRVITDRKGKANIYILNTKGQAVVTLPITVR